MKNIYECEVTLKNYSFYFELEYCNFILYNLLLVGCYFTKCIDKNIIFV